MDYGVGAHYVHFGQTEVIHVESVAVFGHRAAQHLELFHSDFRVRVQTQVQVGVAPERLRHVIRLAALFTGHTNLGFVCVEVFFHLGVVSVILFVDVVHDDVVDRNRGPRPVDKRDATERVEVEYRRLREHAVHLEMPAQLRIGVGLVVHQVWLPLIEVAVDETPFGDNGVVRAPPLDDLFAWEIGQQV